MTPLSPREMIIEIKKAFKEKNITQVKLKAMVEERGYKPPSTSTLSRILSEGSEDNGFNYEWSLIPIYTTLYDIDELKEDDDDKDVARVTVLQQKHEYIVQLEKRLDEKEEIIKELKLELVTAKNRKYEKAKEERERAQKSIDFLKDQIILKDRRYDSLLDTIKQKDELYDQLLKQYLKCPHRKQFEEENNK